MINPKNELTEGQYKKWLRLFTLKEFRDFVKSKENLLKAYQTFQDEIIEGGTFGRCVSITQILRKLKLFQALQEYQIESFAPKK